MSNNIPSHITNSLDFLRPPPQTILLKDDLIAIVSVFVCMQYEASLDEVVTPFLRSIVLETAR